MRFGVPPFLAPSEEKTPAGGSIRTREDKGGVTWRHYESKRAAWEHTGTKDRSEMDAREIRELEGNKTRSPVELEA